MDASLDALQRKKRGLMVDAGLAVGLLLAILVVLIFDRSVPVIVDLVFILDQRTSMRDLIPGMKANCLEKAEALKAGGMDCRFAVIPFGAKRNRIPTVPLTDDVAKFKAEMTTPATADDPEPSATVSEALERALALKFRPEAQVLFFLISKEPCESSGEIDAPARQMSERGITAIVQADKAMQDRCQPLYQNGRFFSMDGADLTASKGRSNSRAASLLAQLAPEKQGGSQLVKVKGLYGLRTDPNRQKIIASLGGTIESENAVQMGLEWLARHQADDGHWSDEAKCEHDRRCGSVKYGAPIAETGLAILAFQAGGNYYFNDQEYSENVTRGLDWLVKQQQQDGRLFGTHTWYEHGIATFALAEACGVSRANHTQPNPRYLDAAQRAIKFMENHQYQRGGWQYSLDSQGIGDTSVTGWQVLALKSAMEAEIDVSQDTMNRVRAFFETVGDPETGRTGYQHRRSSETDLTTAVGLVVQEFILNQPKSQLAVKAVEVLKDRAKGGIGQHGDFYSLYNGTLAMFLAGGDAWDQWNHEVRDAVVSRQEKSGCARGSWNHRYNRTLDTAWAVLTLEVYYRYSTEAK